MTVRETTLPGVLVVAPDAYEDGRGFFFEAYHAGRYAEAGIDAPFVQANLSRSLTGTVRGLHFQRRHPQGKLVQVVRGRVWDVVVDLRRGSPTFGRWEGHWLSDAEHRQLWVPAGFAHGFSAPEDADVLYHCTDVYRPGDEGGVAFDDPDLGVEWAPRAPHHISDKDRALPRLSALGPADLPDVAVAP